MVATDSSSETVSKKFKKATSVFRLPVWARIVRELLALALWLFLFINTVIFDLVGPLAEMTPIAADIFKFRLFIIMMAVAVPALILSRSAFLSTVGYVMCYPLVVVGWLLPKTLIKNWPVLVVFLPAIHSVFANLRYNYFLLTAAFVGGAAVLFSKQTVSIVAGMAVLFVYLTWHFARRMRSAFAPSTVFANVGAALRKISGSMVTSMNTTDLSTLPTGSEEYEKALSQNMLNRYMSAAVLAQIARRLTALHETRQLDLYFIGAFAYTFFLTTAVFSLEYIGLVRVAPASFSSSASLLDMVGYSIGTMFHFQLSQIAPVTLVAQMLTYAQACAALMIGLLLVFVIFTSTRERYRKDVASIADELSQRVRQMEDVMLSDFELTLRAAEIKMMRANALVTGWCLRSLYGTLEAKRREEEITAFLASEVADHSDAC